MTRRRRYILIGAAVAIVALGSQGNPRFTISLDLPTIGFLMTIVLFPLVGALVVTLTGDREREMRRAAFQHLRVHADFVNAGNRFFPPPVNRSSHFGLHVYGPPRKIDFRHLSWLFDPLCLTASLDLAEREMREGELPGVRYRGTWDLRPHADRVVRVTQKVLADWQPAEAAVEQTFVNKDAVATLKLGQARGVAMLAPAMVGISVSEYAPNQVKKTVVGVGHADKHQILVMLRILLPKADPKSPDAADALAVAITHAHHRASPALRLKMVDA